MFTTPPLKIRAAVLDRIHASAKNAGSDECMGLLATPLGATHGIITAACLLPVPATGSHAEADPLTLKHAATELLARDLRPAGLWHSHGDHAVFHSATDDSTVERLLPGMAEWSFERPRHPWAAPVVLGPDRAVLPLPDGQALFFQLQGPELADTPARLPAEWTRIVTTFAKPRQAPRAWRDAYALQLEAGGVAVLLGVPERATVSSRLEDPAPLRISHLYSLVVNNRAAAYAEVMVLHDVEGESLLSRSECPVERVEEAEESGPAFVFLGMDGGAVPNGRPRNGSARLVEVGL